MCTSNWKEDYKKSILGPANRQTSEQGWRMCSMDEVQLEPPTEWSPQDFTSWNFSWASVPQKTGNSGWFCINWEISKNYWWCNKYPNSLFLSGVHVSLTLVSVSKDWHCLVGCWKDPENKEKKIRTEEGMNVDESLPGNSTHKKSKGAAVSLINQPLLSS